MYFESGHKKLEQQSASFEKESSMDATAMSELSQLKKRHQTLFEHSNDAIIFFNLDGDIIDANAKAFILFGCREEQLNRLNASILYPDSEQFRVRKAFEKTRRNGHTSIISKIESVDGTLIDVEVKLALSDPEEGVVQCIFKNIAAQKQIVEALHRTSSELETLIRTTPDIIFRLDTKGRITYISDAVRRYGYTPDSLIGRELMEFVHPEDRNKAIHGLCVHPAGEKKAKELEIRLVVKENQPTDAVFTSKESFDVRYFLIDAEGLCGSDNDSATYRGTQAIARDISEYKQASRAKKKLEAQFLHAQKMEAIGTLAGGIAHDFNNILGAIIGYAQLAEMDLPEHAKANESIRQILDASKRAKGLVGQILAFSRQYKHESIPTDIGPIINEAMKLLRASLPANIEIRQHIASNVGTIMADQTQIIQIVMNLGTNAFHAMENQGGLLEVDLVSMEITAQKAAAMHDIQAGRYLKLSVRDSGNGMDPVQVTRIFDPYYTTKGLGQGTGLGLSTVHGIVKAHGGTIQVDSKPGIGTCFDIIFPCIDAEARIEVKQSFRLPKGTERILLVDDEKVLVDLGAQMLKRLGYQVDFRTSPYDALEAFKVNAAKYDLVITDMTMPKMTGEELAKAIHKIRVDVPIIICTGFSNRMSPEKANAIGFKDFLMKPYTIKELSESIRSVLDSN